MCTVLENTSKSVLLLSGGIHGDMFHMIMSFKKEEAEEFFASGNLLL